MKLMSGWPALTAPFAGERRSVLTHPSSGASSISGAAMGDVSSIAST
eukprot:CAMPEP_0182588498 /NCGR_PEP_ID=MMETSP1324-20130603/67364_1 /TAXON_ID=236786 /ORGANISM="Florenciella sp., Strain RCC1587" /LENGTH=46 /DNA_ID= /DNA_START= /DNA_END= /DNA_ORIENTATION=